MCILNVRVYLDPKLEPGGHGSQPVLHAVVDQIRVEVEVPRVGHPGDDVLGKVEKCEYADVPREYVECMQAHCKG